MDLATYARFFAAMEGKQPTETEAVLASLGETGESLAHARRTFDPTLEHDLKLRAEMGVRILIARGQKPKSLLPPPAVARRVRSSRCFRCGGYKRTEPRTAYVYCDYCGALFDYDTERAHQETGLSDITVFNMLVDPVRAELRRAFAAHDDVAYREAWRWPYEMDMRLFPDSWSPRLGDPLYREAMLHYCVEDCVIQNRRKKDAAMEARMQKANGAMSRPSDAVFHEYVNARRAHLTEQVAAYQQAGIFALHPDKLDGATYIRVNLVLSMLEWRDKLSPKRFDSLLRVAGIDTTPVTLEPTAIGMASCGKCSGKLLIVDGARTVVCEACGHELDRSAAFPCPACGAHLLAPGPSGAKCAWCSTLIAVVA